MLRRTWTLLAVLMTLEVAELGAFFGPRSFPCSVAGDDAPRDTSGNADVVQSARDRVKQWSKLGMWLPDKDVPFFKRNFAAAESVLRDALEDPSHKIRQDAAYVVDKLGTAALPLEPSLIKRIELEPNRTVRLYLYAAARSMEAKSPSLLALLKARFAALEKEPDVRAHDYEYTPVDERLELASALFELDQSPARQAIYRDFILSWLTPPPNGLASAQREAYWDHRWIAVTIVENTGRPREALPFLQAMRTEPDRKAWVYIKVSRALSALGVAPSTQSVPGK
jgi:hypothetical protein